MPPIRPTPADIQAQLYVHDDAAQSCFASHRARAKPSSGSELRFSLVVHVAPSGAVEHVGFHRDLAGDDKLRKCVVDVVKAWSLPAWSGAAVDRTVPLTFTAP